MTLTSFTLKDKQRLQDNRQTVSTVDVSRSGTFAYATIRGFQPIADRFCRQSWEVPSDATALRLTKTMQEDARQRNMGTTLSPFPPGVGSENRMHVVFHVFHSSVHSYC